MECSLKHFTHWVTLTLIIIVAAGCEDHMSVYKPFPGTDCHQFFESAPGIKPVAQTCASNLAFNFILCACDWPYNFVCAFWGFTCLSALWSFHSIGAVGTRTWFKVWSVCVWKLINSCSLSEASLAKHQPLQRTDLDFWDELAKCLVRTSFLCRKQTFLFFLRVMILL